MAATREQGPVDDKILNNDHDDFSAPTQEIFSPPTLAMHLSSDPNPSKQLKLLVVPIHCVTGTFTSKNFHS